MPCKEAISLMKISREELREVCRDKPIFNGCTLVYLSDKYGAENIMHVPGKGFYLRKNARK